MSAIMENRLRLASSQHSQSLNTFTPGSRETTVGLPNAIHAETIRLKMTDWIDAFRNLYMSLGSEREAGVIGVTSALAGEGRTTVALGLAKTLARDVEGGVLIVEADMARPRLASLLDLAPSPGLASVLRGERPLAAVTQVLPEGLSVIQAGHAGANTPRLLRRLASWNPFSAARHLGRLVVVDLPPVLTEAYTPAVAALADDIVFVIRAGETPSTAIREALHRLKDHPVRGAVLNGVAAEALPKAPKP